MEVTNTLCEQATSDSFGQIGYPRIAGGFLVASECLSLQFPFVRSGPLGGQQNKLAWVLNIVSTRNHVLV